MTETCVSKKERVWCPGFMRERSETSFEWRGPHAAFWHAVTRSRKSAVTAHDSRRRDGVRVGFYINSRTGSTDIFKNFFFFLFSRRPRDNRNHLVSPPELRTESPRCLCAAAAAAAARGLVKGFRGATTRGCQCRNSLRADDGKTKSHNNRPND